MACINVSAEKMSILNHSHPQPPSNMKFEPVSSGIAKFVALSSSVAGGTEDAVIANMSQ